MLVVYLLAAAAVPLAITPGLFFHFDITPKILFLILAAVAASLRIHELPRELAALWARRSGRWLILLSLIQIVWFGIATLTSSRPWFSVFGSGWRRMGLVEVACLLVAGVFVAAGLSSRQESSRLLLRIAVSAGFAAAIYGIFQYFGIDPLQPVGAYQAHAGDSVIVRTPGTMGHADYFGWWLAVEFFCAWALARIETGLWKQFAITAAAVIVSAVVLSGTRAALLAVVVGAIAMFLAPPRRFHLQTRHAMLAGAAIAAFAVFYFSPAGTLLRARVVWSGDEPAGGARPLLWRDSLAMTAARPLMGFGPETYLSAFAPYQSEDLSRLFPDYHHESPHNLALDALTSMGVPGLLLLAAWGALIWRSMKSTRDPDFAQPLGAALLASAIASLFSAASLGPILLSLLVLAILIGISAPNTPEPKIPRAAAFPAVIAAIGFLIFGVRLGAYEFRLQQFSRHPDEGSYQLVLAASLPGAADDLYASRMLQLQCQQRRELGSYIHCIQQTLQAAARALHTDDDIATAWYSLAMLSAAQRNIVGTRQGLEEASKASPNWFKPHWTLANLLVQAGEKDKAKVQARRAAFLDSNRDPEVVETLTKLSRD